MPTFNSATIDQRVSPSTNSTAQEHQLVAMASNASLEAADAAHEVVNVKQEGHEVVVAMASNASHEVVNVKQEDLGMGAMALASVAPYAVAAKEKTCDEVPQALPDPKPLPINFGGLRAKKRKASEKEESPATAGHDEDVVNTLLSLKKARISPATQSDQQPADQVTKSQFAPARKGPRSKAKSASTNTEVLDNTSSHPDWYKKVSGRENIARGDVQALAHTRTLIKNCVDANQGNNQEAFDKAIIELTEKLHEIEFCPSLSQAVIKKSNILATGGLYMIFKGDHKHVFPVHLRADAEVLFSRWFKGDLEASLLRGLVTIKSTREDGTSLAYNASVDKGYEFKKSAKVIGSNGLLNGQWFANRLCAMRDGAHAELEPGICGEKDKGAYSIVLANGGYDDKDEGDVIHYCGTQAKSENPTRHTQLLLDAFKLGNSIRVLRAKAKQSIYAPKEGIRYDGLYKIVGEELLEKGTAMYRFELRREGAQGPIRHKGIEARPTAQELAQLKNINLLFK